MPLRPGKRFAARDGEIRRAAAPRRSRCSPPARPSRAAGASAGACRYRRSRRRCRAVRKSPSESIAAPARVLAVADRGSRARPHGSTRWTSRSSEFVPVLPMCGYVERDDLPRIGRVGQDLLVARHRRVEHDFAGRRAGGTDRHAAKHGAVLERKNSRCRQCSGPPVKSPALTQPRAHFARAPTGATSLSSPRSDGSHGSGRRFYATSCTARHATETPHLSGRVETMAGLSDAQHITHR